MRHPVRSFVILAVAAVMTAAVVPDAGAQSRTYQPRKKPVPAASSLPRFALSGDFSGSLTGEIYIEGKAFRIAPDASIYEVGKGLVPLGTSYSNRRIFVSGVQTAGPGRHLQHQRTSRPQHCALQRGHERVRQGEAGQRAALNRQPQGLRRATPCRVG
jgi:hypothetical protein